MKRFVSLLLAVLMTAAVLTGCARQPQTPDRPQEEAVTIRVGGLKGPTSMGLVKLLDDAENQKTANAIDFQMAASANELTPPVPTASWPRTSSPPMRPAPGSSR